VREIVKLQLHQLLAKLEVKGYLLIPSEELLEHIGSTGFDPQFGARPIKRMIQKELLNELSKQIIAGTLETGVPQVIDPAARDKLCSTNRLRQMALAVERRSCCGGRWMSRKRNRRMGTGRRRRARRMCDVYRLS